MSRLVLATGLSFVLLGAARAEACRGPFPPLEENVKRAAVVFVGTVLEVRQLEQAWVISFSVEEPLKGDAPQASTLEVRGATHTCGFGDGVTKGQRFLIFANGSPLATSATSGNRLSPDEPFLTRVRSLLAPVKK